MSACAGYITTISHQPHFTFADVNMGCVVVVAFDVVVSVVSVFVVTSNYDHPHVLLRTASAQASSEGYVMQKGSILAELVNLKSPDNNIIKPSKSIMSSCRSKLQFQHVSRQNPTSPSFIF